MFKPPIQLALFIDITEFAAAFFISFCSNKRFFHSGITLFESSILRANSFLKKDKEVS